MEIAMSMESLTNHFQRYFRIVLAETPELRKQVYRIRYEVYCREFQYEREEDCPGGLEQDDYDEQSLHCLILHEASNTPAGCVRLVKTLSTDSSAPLPFEKFCGSSLNPEILLPSELHRNSLCEISRLAVHPSFRRRKGEHKSPLGYVDESGLNFTESELRTFPLISVALFLAAFSLVVLTGRDNTFVMMEPSLARLLQMSGLLFKQVGKKIEYHGLRAAYHYTPEQAFRDMKPDLREFYDFVYAGLKAPLSSRTLNLDEELRSSNGYSPILA